MPPELAEIADDYYRLRTAADPFGATLFGIRDADDAVPDVTEEGEATRRAAFAEIALAAEQVPVEGLSTTDRVTRSMLVWLARAEVDHLDARWVEFAVSPVFVGPQAQILAALPKTELATPEQAEAYLTRLARLPGFLDASLERLRAGTARGLVPVRRQVEGALDQLDAMLATPVEEDPLLQPTRGGHGDPDRARQLVADEVRPALARFRDRVAWHLAPHARPDEASGVCHLPDGQARYDAVLRTHLTVERTAQEVHDLGLDVLARLEEEYRALGPEALGTADLQALYARLRDDPALHYADPRQAVADAEAAVTRAADALTGWFRRLPATPCAVRPIPEVEARGSAAAYYVPPPPDGSRGGTYWINTTGPVISVYEAEAVAFHEALPGHHLQFDIMGRLDHLPAFRRIGGSSTAYLEGWGLYAERLADEMGLYSSPLTRMGMLAMDSLRAGRLVVDTGIHHLGWSRQQAIDFMLAHSPLAEAMVAGEVDRYIALPGQACGYMVGRLEILRLRAEAERQLGAAFDLATFHDVVLGEGTVPLSTLEELVGEWVAGRATGA